MAASKNLSKKEIEILSILANAENPMTISDIVATNSAYTTNIVQPIIHKLYPPKAEAHSAKFCTRLAARRSKSVQYNRY